MSSDLRGKVAGVPIAPIGIALVAAVIGAIVLPFIPLSKWFPNQSRWLYGAIWFIIGAIVAAFGLTPKIHGWEREVLLGISVAFFIAAFLQWAGWTYAK